MKRIAVILLGAFVLSASLFAQAIQYEIKVKYKNSQAGTVADITVLVKKGEPAFRYYLMTNDPVKGTVLAQHGPSQGKSYTFKNVSPGKYFVKIEDNLGLPAGRTVEIRENGTGTN